MMDVVHDSPESSGTAQAASAPSITAATAVASFAAARVAERIGSIAPSVSAEAPEFMAAVLEVVASQVLQRAGDAAAASSSGRIEPHHIRAAVRRDEDLTRLVGEDALEEGGLLRPPADDA